MGDDKRQADAVKQFEQVLTLRPDHASSLNNLAFVLLRARDPKLRDPRRALTLAERAVERRPDVPDYLNTLTEAYIRNGKLQEWAKTSLRTVAAERGARQR